MRGRICLAVMMTALAAFGYLKSYEVSPTRASWSGWTDTMPPNNWVGQTFIANFDSITGEKPGDVGAVEKVLTSF